MIIAPDKPIDVLVSMPCHSAYNFDMVRTVWDMMIMMQDGCISFQSHFHKGSSITINRIKGVDAAREAKARFILYVDSDQVITDPMSGVNIVKKADAEGLDILSGLYFGKQTPFVPIAAKLNDNGVYNTLIDYPPNHLIECDAVGAGFLLVRTSIFERIPEPWFAVVEQPGRRFPIGEDYFFCRKAKECGYKVYLDTGIKLGHIGEYNYEEHCFQTMKRIIQKEANDKN